LIPLNGIATASTISRPLDRNLWLITSQAIDQAPADPPQTSRAYLVAENEQPPKGFGLYLTDSTQLALPEGLPAIRLPASLGYLTAGDVIRVSPDGRHIRVLWRHRSSQNSVLLTERCDNYCLMCSQPPRTRDDAWLLDEAHELLRLLPAATGDICFTGGEPALYGNDFVDLLRHCTRRLPDTEVHVLSNGRRFTDAAFADEYATINNPKLMIGIPIYGTESGLHDYIVQAPGAFNDTIRGILNLAERSQRVEIRVVLQKHTAPSIIRIAEFIARNLPFVDQVALMGLEPVGFARSNLPEVWIDPIDYQEDLADAALLLAGSGIRTFIYNHQLCVLDKRAWTFAVKSISDWKNEHDPICETCAALEACGGFFHSAQLIASSGIHALDLEDARHLTRSSTDSGRPSIWRAGIESKRVTR